MTTIINVRFPKLKHGYKKSAKANEDLLKRRLKELTISERVGGGTKPKKVKTFRL